MNHKRIHTEILGKKRQKRRYNNLRLQTMLKSNSGQKNGVLVQNRLINGTE